MKIVYVLIGIVVFVALVVVVFGPADDTDEPTRRLPFETVVSDAQSQQIRRIERSRRYVTVELLDGSLYESKIPTDVGDILVLSNAGQLPEIVDKDYPWYEYVIGLILQSLPVMLLAIGGVALFRRSRRKPSTTA